LGADVVMIDEFTMNQPQEMGCFWGCKILIIPKI